MKSYSCNILLIMKEFNQIQIPNLPTMENVFFIRHAQSQLNIASHNFRQKNNLPYIWQLLCQYPEFLSHVKYNHDFIDCSITQKGKEQCLQARQKIMNHINPDIILVSPLERTLETCKLIFQGRNIPVVVQPVLAEAFRSSCDLSFQIQKKINNYKDYNFDKVIKEGDLWFIKNDCEQNQKKYLQALQKSNAKTHAQKNKVILKLMTDTLIFQKPQNVRKRSWKIKELIKSYHQKYSTIAVVAHYNTINYTVSQSFNQNHEPENSANVKNCQVFKANIDNLMKYR